MDKRKLCLVSCIVKHYIQSAEPIGSVVLVEKYHLGYSPATVRAELALLEEHGYMFQPHASSGRIPTQRAYELYVESVAPYKPNPHRIKKIQQAWLPIRSDTFSRLKAVAKVLASETQELVFFSLRHGESYCTGFSYLCEKPEFADKRFARILAQTADRIDEVASHFFARATDEPQVLIGKKNLFSSLGSTVFIGFKTLSFSGVFGIAGPMRMQYEKNMSLLSQTKHLIEIS